MLDKGKELVLGKLRTIQLIEADLHLIIRIFIELRNMNTTEGDEKLSEFNFGSRRNYSIKEVLLEK